MPTDKDLEQDAMIRQNAESIRRNEAAIRRQTEALEKIRDHYFPRKTLWKQACGLLLKAIGAVTVAAGLLETADWYLNTRKTEAMAAESARVAKRLFLEENDLAGATRFLEKAVELDGGTVRYRVMHAYLRGLAAIGDLFDLGRPLTTDERQRVDAILSEAVFLQEVAPEEAMPFVLAAQAYGLRGEFEAAIKSVDRAVAQAPDNVQARVTGCAMRFLSGNLGDARRLLKEAEDLNPTFPLVLYWKGFLAFTVDRDRRLALSSLETLLGRTPRFAVAHVLQGTILADGDKPDFGAARAAFARALADNPKMTLAMVTTAGTYERENNLVLARLWLDRALAQDASCMKALVARARVCGKTGETRTAVADLTAAIGFAPFRADLYRERAKLQAAAGQSAEAAADLKTAEALEGK